MTGTASFDVAFCDTCIGGSTVAAHLALPGLRAFYLADYAVNPLGVRSDDEVRAAVDRWVEIAAARAPVTVVACNTASVRLEGTTRPSGLFTMVDLFDDVLARDRANVEGRRVCLMGTEFTVASPVYRKRLDDAAAVIPLGATLTESTIAHLEHTSASGRRRIIDEIGDTIRNVDVVAHVCTCFPLIADLVADINPQVHQLDPGLGTADLADWPVRGGANHLTVALTGAALSPDALKSRAAELFPGWDEIQVVSLAV